MLHSIIGMYVIVNNIKWKITSFNNYGYYQSTVKIILKIVMIIYINVYEIKTNVHNYYKPT